jgi:hypothetical protein
MEFEAWFDRRFALLNKLLWTFLAVLLYGVTFVYFWTRAAPS